jgi:NAD(P)H dehydrogenase (quinone)
MTSTSSLAGKQALATGGSSGTATMNSDVLGAPIAYQDMSVADCTAALTVAGLPPQMAAEVANADAGLARGELFNDSDDLVKGIGRPATTAHEAVRNTAATIEESR